MRTLLATTAVVLAIAAPAAAALPVASVPFLQMRTQQLFNKRLAMTGADLRITSVACLRESPVTYFCTARTVWTAGPGAGLVAPRYSWNVTLTQNGLINWKISR